MPTSRPSNAQAPALRTRHKGQIGEQDFENDRLVLRDVVDGNCYNSETGVLYLIATNYALALGVGFLYELEEGADGERIAVNLEYDQGYNDRLRA